MKIDKSKAASKLLWIDLEMTGLDISKDVIVEVACEITDFDFKTLASYEAVIKQTEDALGNMNEWSKVQHQASGLTERIRSEGREESEVVHELVGFIKAQFGEEPAVLAGNSIHNDRDFIKKHWPEVNDLLHITAENFATEIKRGLDFYNASSSGAPVSYILLTGGSSKIHDLTRVVEEATGLPTQIMNPFNAISYDPAVFTPDYIAAIAPIAAVPIGLAIRAGAK